MPVREVWDVESRGDDGWGVQREGTERADSLHMTKETAIARGVELAKAAGGQLRIKGENGQIEDERAYGDDPNPPKG
jgi:hypothetical protein